MWGFQNIYCHFYPIPMVLVGYGSFYLIEIDKNAQFTQPQNNKIIQKHGNLFSPNQEVNIKSQPKQEISEPVLDKNYSKLETSVK